MWSLLLMKPKPKNSLVLRGLLGKRFLFLLCLMMIGHRLNPLLSALGTLPKKVWILAKQLRPIVFILIVRNRKRNRFVEKHSLVLLVALGPLSRFTPRMRRYPRAPRLTLGTNPFLVVRQRRRLVLVLERFRNLGHVGLFVWKVGRKFSWNFPLFRRRTLWPSLNLEWFGCSPVIYRTNRFLLESRLAWFLRLPLLTRLRMMSIRRLYLKTMISVGRTPRTRLDPLNVPNLWRTPPFSPFPRVIWTTKVLWWILLVVLLSRLSLIRLRDRNGSLLLRLVRVMVRPCIRGLPTMEIRLGRKKNVVPPTQVPFVLRISPIRFIFVGIVVFREEFLRKRFFVPRTNL